MAHTSCNQTDGVVSDFKMVQLWQQLLEARALDDKDGLNEQVAAQSLEVCNLFYDYVFNHKFRSQEILDVKNKAI